MTTALLMPCPKCGATNRVPQDKVQDGLHPVCGSCKAELPSSDKPIIITDANFAQVVEESPIPIVVDVWAPWCGPCVALAPTIDQLAVEFAGRVRFGKLNVDENQQTAARFGIGGIPALLIYKGGREVDRLVGLRPKAAIAARLAPLLG